MNAARQWLNGGRDWEQGVRLYERSGSDQHLKGIFREGESDTNKGLLFHAIKSLLIADDVKKLMENAKKLPSDADLLPENDISRQAKQEADLLYKQMQNLRANLFALCPSVETVLENSEENIQQRGALAMEVITLQGQVNEAYKRYDYALQHGRLPEAVPEPPTVMDPVFLYKEISNLRKRLSKLRKMEQTAKVLQQISDKETRLEKLSIEWKNATEKP